MAAATEDDIPEYNTLTIVFTGLVALITLSVLIITCCRSTDMQRAIDVIDASADYIACTKRVILVPIVHFFI